MRIKRNIKRGPRKGSKKCTYLHDKPFIFEAIKEIKDSQKEQTSLLMEIKEDLGGVKQRASIFGIVGGVVTSVVALIILFVKQSLGRG